jgi:hypothetical protein
MNVLFSSILSIYQTVVCIGIFFAWTVREKCIFRYILTEKQVARRAKDSFIYSPFKFFLYETGNMILFYRRYVRQGLNILKKRNSTVVIILINKL